jgi:transposase
MEMFETIRREYAAGETISGLARKHGVHRRMIRQALADAVPPERKKASRQEPVLGPLKAVIDGILESDRQAPRKQRHTAHRIWTRLRQEYPAHAVGESTVREYVRKRKLALGLKGREVSIPQSYGLGQEAQVDWYEAQVILDGEARKLQIFAMRSMSSGGAFHRAYTNATQQAFLEAHELAFAYFGGVFRTLRYDNLKVAVKKILRGYQREETERIVAFRSHWGFQAEYCNPGRGNEKGGVEGELGWFRRNWLVPVPEAADLAAFNAWLLRCCVDSQQRRIHGHASEVGTAMREELPHLLPLAERGFAISEVLFPVVVDGWGCVQVKSNRYSTPLRPGNRSDVVLWPNEVDVFHQGERVARHARCYGRGYEFFELEHYLDELERKPGALAGSKPLEQWRAAGRWPDCLDRLWSKMIERHGKLVAAREMVGLVRTASAEGWPRMIAAVEQALQLGTCDGGTVLYIFREPDAAKRERHQLALAAELVRFERPMPDLEEYDALLTGSVQ